MIRQAGRRTIPAALILALLAGPGTAATATAPAPAAAPAKADATADAPAGDTTQLFAGFGAKSKDPIQVDADKLEIYVEGDQRVSVFSGGVVVVRGDSTLKAAKIKLYSDKNSSDTSNTNSFNRMEATGSVYVTSKDQTAVGQSAVVDNKTQLITLVGNVVLTQGKNVVVGDKLVIDMRTSKATVIQTPGKRIKGVFTPKDAKGDTGTTTDVSPTDTKKPKTPKSKPQQ